MKISPFRVILSICFFLTFCSAFYVGQNIPLCLAPNEQYFPTAISDGDGGAVLAWEDYRDGEDWNLFAQRVDAKDTLKWAKDGHEQPTSNIAQPNLGGMGVCKATGFQRRIVVVKSGDNFIFSWNDKRSGSNWDIYAQAVSAAGAPRWSENGVGVCVHPAEQSDQVAIPDGKGGVIIAWQDFRNGDNNLDIYAQRIDAAGKTIWAADGIPLCTDAGRQSAPAIISDGDGGAIIAWLDLGVEYWHIFAQRLNADGKTVWAQPVMVAPSNASQGELRMIADNTGGAIVVWQAYENYLNDNIFAQRINRKGEKLWGNPPLSQTGEGGIVVCQADGVQKHPLVVSDVEGGAIVAWADERDVFSDIYAQRISPNGEVKWQKDGVPVCTAGGHQDAPLMVNDKKGNVVIAWRDYREDYKDTLNDAIYAQKLTPEGISVWETDGRLICAAEVEHRTPVLVSDAAGGAIVIWSDGRNDAGDIFLQRTPLKD